MHNSIVQYPQSDYSPIKYTENEYNLISTNDSKPLPFIPYKRFVGSKIVNENYDLFEEESEELEEEIPVKTNEKYFSKIDNYNENKEIKENKIITGEAYIDNILKKRDLIK